VILVAAVLATATTSCGDDKPPSANPGTSSTGPSGLISVDGQHRSTTALEVQLDPSLSSRDMSGVVTEEFGINSAAISDGRIAGSCPRYGSKSVLVYVKKGTSAQAIESELAPTLRQLEHVVNVRTVELEGSDLACDPES
jgi:hypothetical protein